MSAPPSSSKVSAEQQDAVSGREPLRDVTAAPHPPHPPPRAPLDEGDDSGFAEYLRTILGAPWVIVAATVATVIAGGAYVVLATPVYRSDVLLQVEDKSKSGVKGLEDLSAMFGATTPAETEIEIIRSRSLVGYVVDALHLDVTAEPVRFPVVGGALARRRVDGLAAPVAGLTSFAWGGERIVVSRLDVPPQLLGEKLTLVAGEGGRYELLGTGGQRLLEGEVGKPAAAADASLYVSELSARPGTRFTLVREERDTAIEQLQKDLMISEKGKKTGILQIALDGEDRARLAATLDAIAERYLRQNVERKSEEAERTLEFLNGQLPTVKANLDAAEAALNAYRSKKGGASVDLSLETKAMLERSADIEKGLTELEMQRAELRRRFTDSHPALQATNQKINQLREDKVGMEGRFKTLPESELQSVRLMRDVKVANELYVLMLNKTQELSVVKSGTIGNVRILDRAVRAKKPVSPNAGATLAIATLLGLTLGVALTFVKRILHQGVEDPDVVERITGLPVYSSVPHSEEQTRRFRGEQKRGSSAIPLLAAIEPNALAVEAVRSLRTSIHFALGEARGNVLTVGGPSPGIGKSFIAANLAHVLAEAGQRVLLVDADLRKGRLHHYLAGEKAPGLADVIMGGSTAEAAVRATGHANLFFLPTGRLPSNPSELLNSERFRQLVASLSRSYDLVLIDTPPILAVTDAAIIARVAGVKLLVFRAGQHTSRELALTVKRFAQNGVSATALVLNDVHPKRSLGYYDYNYQYTYR